MMAKIIFTIKPHSVIDVITNSSTELFVGRYSSKEAIEELIEKIYPNYLNEYEKIKTIDDLTVEELDQYFDYFCYPHSCPSKKSDYPILPGFTFEELYEEDGQGVAWNGELQYILKNNYIDPDPNEDPWLLPSQFITKENFEEMKRKLDPNKEMLFLYSIEENPNLDYQEQLLNIMTRIHLG